MHEEYDVDAPENPAADRPEPTGQAEVDEVVDEVAGLDETPLEEHVAVFERAHARLRGTLDTRG